MEKLEIWIFGVGGGREGVFCNFGFGLRKKSWKIEFGGGGYSVTSDLDLGKKCGKLNSRGEVFCNFGFGLREKVGKLNSGGGYSVTWDLDLGKKVGKLNSGGVFCNFRFELRKKS